MIINCDAKQLEWVCAAFLSQDEVAIKEIWDGVDVHETNRAAFDLPTRTIAKIFLFRLIYGGSAYSYAHDPDFTEVSTSQAYWEEVIRRTYAKYTGLGKWHTSLIREVTDRGMLIMPTGRRYIFPAQDAESFRTQILNYPVQGLGADLVSIARVSLSRRMKILGLKSLLISTVHDSIVVDALQDEAKMVCQLMFDVFDDIPKNFERLFKTKFNLPMRCEISIGNNWEDTTEVTKEFLNAD